MKLLDKQNKNFYKRLAFNKSDHKIYFDIYIKYLELYMFSNID